MLQNFKLLQPIVDHWSYFDKLLISNQENSVKTAAQKIYDLDWKKGCSHSIHFLKKKDQKMDLGVTGKIFMVYEVYV